MAGFLVGRQVFKDCLLQFECPAEESNCGEFMTDRRNRGKKTQSFPSQHEHVSESETFVLDQVFRVVDQDPERFAKEWLQPLLLQGLSLDRAWEVIFEIFLRPN